MQQDPKFACVCLFISPIQGLEIVEDRANPGLRFAPAWAKGFRPFRPFSPGLRSPGNGEYKHSSSKSVKNIYAIVLFFA